MHIVKERAVTNKFWPNRSQFFHVLAGKEFKGLFPPDSTLAQSPVQKILDEAISKAKKKAIERTTDQLGEQLRSHPHEGHANVQGDRIAVGLPLSALSSRSNPKNVSLESSDSRNLSAISRPDLHQTASEFDPDNCHDPSVLQQLPGATLDHFSQKIGSLLTLDKENYSSQPKNHHARSVSQPGSSFGPATQGPPFGIDPRFCSNSVPASRQSLATGGSFGEGGGVAPSISMNQTVLTNSCVAQDPTRKELRHIHLFGSSCQV